MNFFDEYYNVGTKIRSKESRKEYFTAIIEYYYTGEEPEFKTESAEIAFEGIRFSLEKSRTNSRNKRKRNANEIETNDERNANESSNETKTIRAKTTQPFARQKEKEKEIESSSNEEPPIAPDNELATKVVRLLNERTGSSFKANTKATVSLVNARAKEGYGYGDFKAVIENRAAKWGDDPKMREYLRPSTLFSPKFEGYLSEARREVERAERFAKYD